MFLAKRESSGWRKTRMIQTTESDGFGPSTLPGSPIHNYSLRAAEAPARNADYLANFVFSDDSIMRRIKPYQDSRSELGRLFHGYAIWTCSKRDGNSIMEVILVYLHFHFMTCFSCPSFDIGFASFWNSTFNRVSVDSAFICLDLYFCISFSQCPRGKGSELWDGKRGTARGRLFQWRGARRLEQNTNSVCKISDERCRNKEEVRRAGLAVR